jgi:hypothetical protein
MELLSQIAINILSSGALESPCVCANVASTIYMYYKNNDSNI